MACDAREELEELLLKEKIDIVSVSETHLKLGNI
jgi:hypothetical protein